MPINPEIRDQAYQFFIEEAPELLQAIEAGLLTLKQERSTGKVHDLMRAAHSLKGGAASVELETVKTLAHRLENIFKALYDDTIDIDTDLESQLLQAYDCLRLPLMAQIQTGNSDGEQALALAEPIFAQIEERLGDALAQADTYIPSSSELGVDMALSIFEVDVAQGLERLSNVVANPKSYEIAGELRAQAEVFAGFAELLNQPGFGAIAKITLDALDTHPERALVITQLALTDFQFARQAVLAAHAQGSTPATISPSPALLALAKSTTSKTSNDNAISAQVSIAEIPTLLEDSEEALSAIASEAGLEEIFSNVPELLNETLLAHELFDESSAATEILEDIQNIGTETALEAIFANAPELLNESLAADIEQMQTWEAEETLAAISANVLEDAVQNTAPTSEVEAEEEELQAESPTQPSNIQQSKLQPSTPETVEEAVQSIKELFDKLQPLQEIPAPSSQSNSPSSLVPAQAVGELSHVSETPVLTSSSSTEVNLVTTDIEQGKTSPTPTLSVRVDSDRLERMNNLVGELAINRNGLSLQNEQLQGAVRELLSRFSKVQSMVGLLQELSDQMLVDRLSHRHETLPHSQEQLGELVTRQAEFDSLELDSYGTLHSRLQGLLEDMVPLEESVDDIVLFARATDTTLEQQRQMLTQLRDELMWARMVPLGEVLNRFPRVLRDLSTNYHKPVSLKLNGTGVLVDKAALEKLYDPLLHLLRNAFDHGIEPPEIRHQHGKPEQGQIEIKAYHQGSQTIIEVKDDGQGLNLERIGRRAVELGLLSTEQLAVASNNRLFELLFEPGFSTASQVSELSGRGVGLDVVRSHMRSLKGSITVASSPGVGTTFTLRLPLTLTIAKLLVCMVGSTAMALPSDSVEEIVVPKADRVKTTGQQRFLRWREQVVPAYRLSELLEYNCPLPETSPSKALVAVASPQDWALPMLILRQEQHVLALEIDRLVTEQELVIKPFGSAIAPPTCTYGCTILGDGSLIPVIDGAVLLEQVLGQNKAATATPTASNPEGSNSLLEPVVPALQENSSVIKTTPTVRIAQAPTVLIVDDAVALRRTLALTLERGGCRVLQARDGREAIEQLHQTSAVKLVVCDIEMPNMNGFEFLSYRRQDPQISNIPVVMLTSRSNDKHRWLAMHLGANAYFTKPYLEQDFLAAIKNILASQPAPYGSPQVSTGGGKTSQELVVSG